MTDNPNWDRRFDGLPDNERCQTCGQPDNCGDCDHVRLTDEQATFLTTDQPVVIYDGPDNPVTQPEDAADAPSLDDLLDAEEIAIRDGIATGWPAWACEGRNDDDHPGQIVVWEVTNAPLDWCPTCNVYVDNDCVRAIYLDEAFANTAPQGIVSMTFRGTMAQVLAQITVQPPMLDHGNVDEMPTTVLTPDGGRMPFAEVLRPVTDGPAIEHSGDTVERHPMFQVVGEGTYDATSDAYVPRTDGGRLIRDILRGSTTDTPPEDLVALGDMTNAAATEERRTLRYGGMAVTAQHDGEMDEADDVAIEMLAGAGYGPDEIIEDHDDRIEVCNAQTLIMMGYLLGKRMYDISQ